MNYKNLLLSFIPLLFIACVNEKKEEIIIEDRPKVVKVFNLEDSQNFKNTRKYPALIYSLQDSTMAFEVSGKITKFYYDEGDFIKKGSVIAKLDDTIYKADYNSALANFEQAKRDFKRYKKLYESKSVPKRVYETVSQNLDIARSNFFIAKKRLEDTKLKAEFDGVVAKKLVKDFERITAKQPIIRVQDNTSFKVKFFAPESDILYVKEKITKESAAKLVDFFVTIGEIKESIPAKFINISTTAEEVSRTFEITLLMKPLKNKNIFSGMTANVLAIEKQNQNNNIFIPLKAIFSDASRKSYVWIVDSFNRVHKQEVKTGRLEKDSIEILDGVKNFKKVVISGVRFLEENDEIKEYKKIGN